MKTIKILGTGCAKCKKTEEMVRQYIVKNNMDARIEKVEDIMEILKYNVMNTPAVVVDENVKIAGKVPSENDINDALK